MTFGENIKRYRMANGLTMEELARQRGYSSRSTINKIERDLSVQCRSTSLRL